MARQIVGFAGEGLLGRECTEHSFNGLRVRIFSSQSRNQLKERATAGGGRLRQLLAGVLVDEKVG